jgi:UDP-glucuronate decarboxylase
MAFTLVHTGVMCHSQQQSPFISCLTEGFSTGKRVAETLCMDYKREHDLEVKIVRIFNTYGPRMALDDGRVVSNFLAQALRGEDITVYGDGLQTRSFQYVSDLIAGIVAVMGTDANDCGPYNVGNPGEFTMLELAGFVKQVSGSKSQISFQENTADDPKQRKPDITKVRTNLGWEPRVPLKRGLELMIDDFKKRLGLQST